MKKFLFLFAMMFMTSVSAYSWKQHYGYQEKEILIDIIVKVPGKGLKVWWRNHPMLIWEYNQAYTEVIVDL